MGREVVVAVTNGRLDGVAWLAEIFGTWDWAYNEKNAWAVLVTVYRPDPDRWIDYRVRGQP